MKKNFNYQEILGDANPLLRYPHLLEAAIDEFSQKKFEDASLNDILKKANMSKGSLYHNFADKFGLYLCVMDVFVKKKIAFFSSFIQKNQGTGDFFGTMKQVIRATTEFMLVDERLHHLYNRILEGGEELTSQLIEFFPYDYSQAYSALIKKAIESGQISKQYTPQFIAKVFEILLSNSHKFVTKDSTPQDAIDTIDQLIDFMQHGIEAIQSP